ncbi:MAG: hypothetical protein F9K15_19190 [Zoogloea sp.]|nr:MAG: hypothetical protein F9K15_19190 [Zoogloea sp.]
MACLVLFWAGTSMADDNVEAAAELADLAEQVQQVSPVLEASLDLDAPDPLDCPALACEIRVQAQFLLEDPPRHVLCHWLSVTPRQISPPPRLG